MAVDGDRDAFDRSRVELGDFGRRGFVGDLSADGAGRHCDYVLAGVDRRGNQAGQRLDVSGFPVDRVLNEEALPVVADARVDWFNEAERHVGDLILKELDRGRRRRAVRVVLDLIWVQVEPALTKLDSHRADHNFFDDLR